MRTVLAIVCLAMLGGMFGCKPPVDLRLKWAAGQTGQYQSTLQINSHSTGTPAGPVNGAMTQTYLYGLTVLSVAEDGAATEELVVQNVIFKARDGGGMGGDMDLSKPAEPAEGPNAEGQARLRQMYSALKGKKIRVVMAPSGAVSSIEGMKEIAAAARAGGTLTDKQMGMFMGEDMIKGILGGGDALLPDEPVKAGATWSRDMSGDSGRQSIDLTLKKIEAAGSGRVARITMKIHPSGGDGGVAGMKVTHGAGTGEMSIDLETGQLLLMSMELPSSTDMSFGGASIHTEATTSITIEKK